MPSPLLVGDELYFVNDSSGILTCLDAETGKEIYRERLGRKLQCLAHGGRRPYLLGQSRRHDVRHSSRSQV